MADTGGDMRWVLLATLILLSGCGRHVAMDGGQNGGEARIAIPLGW